MNQSDAPGLIRYHFRHAIGGFFEFPTESARRMLPADIQPVEPHHGSSVLSVMAFDFHDSPAGSYGELILSILVSPLVRPGQPVPRSAFYPFRVATTTRASREHAIEEWHLAHHMKDIAVDWTRKEGRVTMRASEPGGGMIVELSVTEHDWSDVEHRYQSFMADDDGLYTANLIMAGQFSDHEEERGTLAIGSGGMADLINKWDITLTPFRELWMKDGVEAFYPLEQLASNGSR